LQESVYFWPYVFCISVSFSGFYDIRGHHHQAIKDVSASYDAIVDLFESIETFLRRLDIYIKIPSTFAMTEIIVKILIELLSTLGLATKHVKQGRLSKSIIFPNTVRRASTCLREIRKEVTRRE
jgi:hypothetical protein